ncbi:MAG: hypothetical protein LBT59_07325, partial [Clostridiales bacterium]|nr:hypothetical protein [Clostridiales bacterium]
MEDKAIEAANLHLENAAAYTMTGEFEKSFRECEKADEILNDLEDSMDVLELKATSFECKAKYYKVAGRVKESTQLIKKAIDIWSSLEFEEKERRDRVNFLTATSYIELEDIDKAVAYADKILNGNSEEGFYTGMYFLGIAHIYMRNESKYYKSAKKALLVARSYYVPRLSLSTVTFLIEIQSMLAKIAHKYEKNNKKALQELDRSWELIEKIGIKKCDQDLIMTIPTEALAYCQGKVDDEYKKWIFRTEDLFGNYIETGEFKHHEALNYYLSLNISWFIGHSTLSKSLTIDRALKCLESMKSVTQNPEDIAKAQWLAGCALINIGTEKDARRGVRLIKRAAEILRATNDSIYLTASAIGEGYIAAYHFSNEEYDEAERWYRVA